MNFGQTFRTITYRPVAARASIPLSGSPVALHKRQPGMVKKHCQIFERMRCFVGPDLLDGRGVPKACHVAHSNPRFPSSVSRYYISRL